MFTDDCPNCVDEHSSSLAASRWTMPLLKLGEKRYYLGIFFKVSRLPVTLIYLYVPSTRPSGLYQIISVLVTFPLAVSDTLLCIECQAGLLSIFSPDCEHPLCIALMNAGNRCPIDWNGVIDGLKSSSFNELFFKSQV